MGASTSHNRTCHIRSSIYSFNWSSVLTFICFICFHGMRSSDTVAVKIVISRIVPPCGLQILTDNYQPDHRLRHCRRQPVSCLILHEIVIWFIRCLQLLLTPPINLFPLSLNWIMLSGIQNVSQFSAHTVVTLPVLGVVLAGEYGDICPLL
jgi:hypothetical protein